MASATRRYVAAGALVAVVLGGSARAWSRRQPLVAPPLRVTRAYVDAADTLARRETLSILLARRGIVGRDRTAFLAAATALPARRLRPGLVLSFRRLVTDSVPTAVAVLLSPEWRVRLERGAEGWTETVDTIPWQVSRIAVHGVIATSLYDALDKAVDDSVLPVAERRTLAWALADVYDWDIDFTRDVRPGDQFRVLVERRTSAEGDTRVGQILAAMVQAGRATSYAYRFAPPAAAPGFYDTEGRSLKRAFLRAPLQFRRITSGFGIRYHPILHEWRHHDGIDFAAPYGTPVRATADGRVSVVGWDGGGYGNYIELRHANGIRTRYGHLSAFARGLRVGERVTQGETIGFVGSTGLSTGPHLHYEFLVGGHATNPRARDVGTGTPVPSTLRARYDSVRAQLQTALDSLDQPPIDAAGRD
jgi:murein DD-endopeptidase MepM/ murein hydrolase activator NlpD